MSEQKNKYGDPVKLGILHEEIYMSYAPEIREDQKEEYKKQMEKALEQYEFYNVLDGETLHMYSRSFAEAKGWEIPQTDFTHGGRFLNE